MTFEANNTNDLKVLRGKIKRISYASEETGFTVLELNTDKFPMGITVTGVGLPTVSGLEVIFKGNFQSHHKFGRQFKVTFWEQVAPTDEASIINFLSSGIFPGIGEKKAAVIYKHFGDDTLKIIEQTPYRLEEISGIGPKKIDAINSAYQKHQGQLEIRRYFLDLGLTPNQSQSCLLYTSPSPRD